MPIRCLRVALLAPLTAALLPACGANGLTKSTTASATSAMTPTTSTPTTTAVAAPPATEGPKTAKWIDLRVGDCLADPPPTDPSVVFVTIVDCAGAHAAEVYLRVAVEVNAAIADIADRECALGLPRYTGRPANSSPFATTYLIDSNQDRTSDNPMPSTVICLLQAADGGPLKGSAHP